MTDPNSPEDRIHIVKISTLETPWEPVGSFCSDENARLFAEAIKIASKGQLKTGIFNRLPPPEVDNDNDVIGDLKAWAKKEIKTQEELAREYRAEGHKKQAAFHAGQASALEEVMRRLPPLREILK